MKAYQVRVVGGSYDEYYNCDVATYIHREDAENHIRRLLEKQAESIILRDRCLNCDLPCDISKEMFEKIKDTIAIGCKNRDIIFDDGAYFESIYCKNEISSYLDIYDERYSVKELDIIE